MANFNDEEANFIFLKTQYSHVTREYISAEWNSKGSPYYQNNFVCVTTARVQLQQYRCFIGSY